MPRGLLAAAAVALVSSEYLHWRASGRHLGATPQPGAGPHVVLVLGYPSSTRSPNAMQRWRTDVAVRSAGDHGRLVVSGGATRRAGRTEAQVMSDDAQRRRGVPGERITLETSARSTWENVALSAPLLGGAGTLAIASSPLHAARARGYLHRQHPHLAARLVMSQDYRLGEHPLLKLATVAYQVRPRRAAGLFPRPLRQRSSYGLRDAAVGDAGLTGLFLRSRVRAMPWLASPHGEASTR